MKQLAVILCSMIVFSCDQRSQTQNVAMQKANIHSYATKLIDNGFLKYADTTKLDSLKNHLVTAFNIYDDAIFKMAHIDAEELAEFSFEFFLPDLNRILAKRDITISVQKLNNKDNSFDILINGDTIQLYTQTELENGTFWATAPSNFFRKVNDILRSKNRGEQFYLLYGGNDLQTMLLTEKQFSIITEYYKDEAKERPYKP